MEELSEILFKFIGFAKRERKRGVYILDDKLNDDQVASLFLIGPYVIECFHWLIFWLFLVPLIRACNGLIQIIVFKSIFLVHCNWGSYLNPQPSHL